MIFSKRLILVLATLNMVFSQKTSSIRPVSTYSIVALDETTGELGVAVQSHWFSVGFLVPWAKAGVGAVATQSFVKVDYGPDGIQLMESGMKAADALKALTSKDEGEAVRQVGMIDIKGNVAAHTGSRCIKYAGHIVGENYSVQANMMANGTVPKAMAIAFEETKGDLADRMMAALEAAEAEAAAAAAAAIAALEAEQAAAGPTINAADYIRTNGASVTSITANADDDTVIITINANDDGELKVTLHEKVIKAFDDGSYFVLIDNAEVWFEQSGPVLTIPYEAGNERIEIVGSHVVPEFGTIAMIILAVAIVSIIAITAKTKISLIPRL